MKTRKNMRGVTLVEIAIVLVIIGLLLGGVLKGQELINNARVRAIADQQKSMQVAWNAFQERFQAIPGDFPRATRYIKRTVNGLGDGQITPPANATSWEAFLTLNHLTEAGFLRCTECAFVGTLPTAPTAQVFNSTTGLRNTYGGIMAIFHDTQWLQIDTNSGGTTRAPQVISSTGPLVPSNILSEVDLKIDDGIANAGSFRYLRWLPTPAGNGAEAPAAQIGECTNDDNGNPLPNISPAGIALWRSASRQPAAFANCNGALLIQ